MYKPGSPVEPGREAHGVDPCFSRPIGEGRPVEYRRTDEAAAVGRKQRDRPAGLTITVKDRRTIRVAMGHDFHEAPERVQHIGEGLPMTRLREKRDEIDRIAVGECDAHFGVLLESADARPMSRPRIQDQYRRLLLAASRDVGSGPGQDPQQHVIDRTLEPARVENRLEAEVQERRQPPALMFNQIVGSLSKRVPEEDRTFQKIATICP